MKRITIIISVIVVAFAAVLVACSKDDETSTTLKIRLTDNPVAAEEVNVDIRQVRVNLSDDSTSWVDLTTNAGIYNLLGLQNGVDTLLATGQLTASYVKEIRFVLGSNNSIKVAGVTYPLIIPSGSESGLKIKVNKQLNVTLDSLLIDFDAALSVHQIGTGTYHLKPVLKIK